MKKLFTYLLSAMMMIFAVSCEELLENGGLSEEQVVALEELCTQMNTNISSLQSLVTALQNDNYVTDVTSITKNGEVVGYTISFTNCSPISIYYKASTEENWFIPILGVKQDTDGIYYLTINGDWLLDGNGNQIQVQSSNNTSPKLKVDDGGWYISFDNGYSWVHLGEVVGESDFAGKAMFKNINLTNSDYVIITLADGSELSLPRYKNISISFDVEDGVACMPLKSIKVGYTVNGADEKTTIEATCEGAWKAVVSKTSVSEGYLTVTAPASGGNGSVVMHAIASNGFTATKAITFDEGVLTGVSDAYQVEREASTLQVNLQTNLAYTVNISDDAKSWISVADTRATIRTDVLTFTIEENPEENPARSATIKLMGEWGDELQSFVVMQKTKPQPQWKVRTVAGEKNDKGALTIIDGPFGDCGSIMNAATFAADPLNPLHVYVSSDLYTGGATTGVDFRSDVRLIDFEKKEVHTIFNANYFNGNRIRDVRFTNDEEANMLVAIDDFGSRPAVILVKRSAPGATGKEAFFNQPWHGLVYNTAQCNGIDVHPKTGSIFFNRYDDGSFHKFPDTDLNPNMTSIYDCLYYPADHDYHKAQKMFAGEKYLEARVEIHPAGKYMLILQFNGGSYIAKSEYDETTDTFKQLYAYVGKHSTQGGGHGYVDDVGTEAKTNYPRQIAWVKNPDYAGQEDEYDAYFTDRSNHCIRKITPSGVVSTFAGRGSGTGNPWGYADGLALGEALFDCPCALIYNEERNVFWVGDTWNACIREIYFE
ncbi:MAG: hypothetical protein II299_04470 [Alistipes sp.]|nr:hypothetical protein [Alistipes sp.]